MINPWPLKRFLTKKKHPHTRCEADLAASQERVKELEAALTIARKEIAALKAKAREVGAMGFSK